MHLLLSGATGYLGKHLLARLLRDGHSVVVLVRGGDDARVLDALAPLAVPTACRAPHRLAVVDCDLTREDQLPGALFAPGAARFDACVHLAGLTRFEDHLAAELDAQNVGGTRQAWRLAQALAIPRFHHVSTAYVAGTAASSFGADALDVGQSFNNPYEASKFAAECWLHAQAVRGQPALVVHRPSIVVGGHALGARRTVSTLYTFMKAVQFVCACCERDAARGRYAFAPHGFRRTGQGFHLPLRVAADPDSTVNLVAMDDVVDGIVDALQRPLPRAQVDTIALTGQDYRIEEVAAAITSTLRLSGVSLVHPAAFDAMPRSMLEAQFHRLTRVYAPYLLRTPRFPSRPGARTVDLAQLTREFLAQDAAARAVAPRLGTLALDTLGIHAPRDYFLALCDGAVGRHFLARHSYVNATVGFRLGGAAPCDVTLRFEAGRATAVSGAAAACADCRYELDAALFMRIVHGEADLRASFLAGRVRITGDKELALKFGALLGTYYGRLEEHLIAEISA